MRPSSLAETPAFQRFSFTTTAVAPSPGPRCSLVIASPSKLQLVYTVPSHGSVNENVPARPPCSRKNSSKFVNSPSFSSSSRISHRFSGALNPRNLCSLPSRNRSTWVENRLVRSAGYCATAPVFNAGKFNLRLPDHVVEHARFEHRLPDGHGDVTAVVQE